jgi:hypothetical protein
LAAVESLRDLGHERAVRALDMLMPMLDEALVVPARPEPHAAAGSTDRYRHRCGAACRGNAATPSPRAELHDRAAVQMALRMARRAVNVEGTAATAAAGYRAAAAYMRKSDADEHAAVQRAASARGCGSGESYARTPQLMLRAPSVAISAMLSAIYSPTTIYQSRRTD